MADHWTQAELDRFFARFPLGGPNPPMPEFRAFAEEMRREPAALLRLWMLACAHRRGEPSRASTPVRMYLDRRRDGSA